LVANPHPPAPRRPPQSSHHPPSAPSNERVSLPLQGLAQAVGPSTNGRKTSPHLSFLCLLAHALDPRASALEPPWPFPSAFGSAPPPLHRQPILLASTTDRQHPRKRLRPFRLRRTSRPSSGVRCVVLLRARPPLASVRWPCYPASSLTTLTASRSLPSIPTSSLSGFGIYLVTTPAFSSLKTRRPCSTSSSLPSLLHHSASLAGFGSHRESASPHGFAASKHRLLHLSLAFPGNAFAELENLPRAAVASAVGARGYHSPNIEQTSPASARPAGLPSPPSPSITLLHLEPQRRTASTAPTNRLCSLESGNVALDQPPLLQGPPAANSTKTPSVLPKLTTVRSLLLGVLVLCHRPLRPRDSTQPPEACFFFPEPPNPPSVRPNPER